MSNGRRAARPVRQLSLQQPVPRRQHIRRQRSAEDDCGKSLQIYANPIARGRLAANATEKPKVRVAWSDDRRGSNNAAQVEVVARQIPSRSRPTTGRSGRPYVAMEKASILYSRQELAERLRLAWKHREQKKANIDIFLAHGVTVGERCDSEMSMSAPPTPLSRQKSDSVHNDEEDSQNPEASGDLVEEKKTSDKEDECERSKVASPTTENDLSTKKDENVAESVEKEENEEATTTSHANSDPEEKKKKRINIDCTNLHLSTTSVVAFPSLKPDSAATARPNDNFVSAKQKRANFHSCTNRAFLVPMTEKSPKASYEAKDRIASAKLVEMRCASADKTATRSDKGVVFARTSSTVSLDKTRRTSSAPLQKRNVASATRVQVNIVIDTPGLGEMTDKSSIVCGKTQDGKDATEKNEEGPTKILRGERPIKSAPLKRRSKSTKKRFLGSSDPSRDEDRGGRGKGSVDPRTSDVITMVSLVSSADSDSDVEKLPGDDKLIDELRSKLPTTPIIKTSLSTNPGTARKPIKSVSFQRDSFDEETPATREERQTVSVQPSRFGFAVTLAHRNENSEQKPAAVVNGIAATTTTTTTTTQPPPPPPPLPPPLPISALIIAQNAEEETLMPEAPLTDREKRCLAVPIGDLHDKKRKLLRTRSTPSRPISRGSWYVLRLALLRSHHVRCVPVRCSRDNLGRPQAIFRFSFRFFSSFFQTSSGERREFASDAPNQNGFFRRVSERQRYLEPIYKTQENTRNNNLTGDHADRVHGNQGAEAASHAVANRSRRRSSSANERRSAFEGRTVCEGDTAVEGGDAARRGDAVGAALPNDEGKGVLASLQENVRQGRVRVL